MIWSLRVESSRRFESLCWSSVIYFIQESLVQDAQSLKQNLLQPSSCQDTPVIHRKRLFFWHRDAQDHADRAKVVVWGLDPLLHSILRPGLEQHPVPAIKLDSSSAKHAELYLKPTWEVKVSDQTCFSLLYFCYAYSEMGRCFFIVFFWFPAAATPHHYCWAWEPAHHTPAQLPLHKLPNDRSGSKRPRCVSRALNHLLLASGWNKKRNQPNSMEKTMRINTALPAAAKAKHWIVNNLARGDDMQHRQSSHPSLYSPLGQPSHTGGMILLHHHAPFSHEAVGAANSKCCCSRTEQHLAKLHKPYTYQQPACCLPECTETCFW